MLLDVSPPLVDILLLDSQVNEEVINNRKNICGMIRLIIMKSSHHPINKKLRLNSKLLQSGYETDLSTQIVTMIKPKNSLTRL